MANATGSALDLEDLLSKLDTFATGLTTAPWSSIYATNPDTTNRWFELKKGSISVSMRYPASIGVGDSISVHHATGSVSALTAPGAHTADSGNGYNTGVGGTAANFLTERCLSEIGNGPFPSYHFFADDTTQDYVHCVIEFSSGKFRHLNFGTLDKFGDNWVGGEYVCGDFFFQSAGLGGLSAVHSMLFDGVYNIANAPRASTIRIASGLANQSPAVWGVCAAGSTFGTDTAGNVRRQIHGSFRAGMEPAGYANPTGSESSGVIPMYSLSAYYRDPTNPHIYLLGYMPDVRCLNIRNFAVGQEIVEGANTWKIFPMSFKSIAGVIDNSDYMGIAYRKF